MKQAADHDDEHCLFGCNEEGYQTSCTDEEGGGECRHCPCCCECLSCEYGPRDGMLLTEQQRAPIADLQLDN